MTDFEKLGMFYLGRKYDPVKKQLLDDLMMYDSKDLVTHGVCVGMTGSGKTGLCISLLEEAAIDNIPALIIDPKGDMTNLLLTFPDLQPEDFGRWINTDDASREGQTPEQYAKAQAELWKKGLADWGQDGKRIQKLKDSAQFTIFTPGSSQGVPVSIMNSFACPPAEVLQDDESLGDVISTTTTGLLGLVGINADPIKSREHILIANIIQYFWKMNRDVDLAGLITAIQKPPFDKVGAFTMDSFFPEKERFELALALNNLLAAPGFGSWLQGEPLDIGRLLYGANGKPRMSIFYIAHLNDSERMFFVTLLLNQMVSWMRSQPGTTSLRALVYMDEVAGYLPPVAMPPSKKPLLLMFKQARAFGVGVLLATQNPIDLDYKALSNAGTWFIGRLQTQKDIERIIEGLRTSAGGVDEKLTKAISGLGKRVFLVKNIHEDDAEIFQTRWALSYLRGPLTLAQIKQLTPAGKATEQSKSKVTAAAKAKTTGRPAIPPQLPEYFAPLRGVKENEAQLCYQPAVFGMADLQLGPGETQRLGYLAAIRDVAVPVDWDGATPTTLKEDELEKEPAAGAAFDEVPAVALKPDQFKNWDDELADMLFRTSKMEVYKSASLKQTSRPGESERDFRIRLSQMAREQRDQAVEELRRRYASKTQTLQDRIQRAQQKIEKEKSEFASQSMQTAINVGATILGAFLGRKTVSASTLGRAGTAMRSGMRSVKEHGDVSSAEEGLDVLQQRLADMEAELNSEIAAIDQQTDPLGQKLETVSIRPKKTDIGVRLTVLLWLPHWQWPDGKRKACYE